MKKYLLYWKGYEEEPDVIEGKDLADACKRSGISAGALQALNYWEEIKSK